MSQQIPSKTIEKAILKGAKKVIAESGIGSSTRSGNKELSHLITSLSKQPFSTVQVAHQYGESLGHKIVELSQQSNKNYLDGGVIRLLRSQKKLPSLTDLPEQPPQSLPSVKQQAPKPKEPPVPTVAKAQPVVQPEGLVSDLEAMPPTPMPESVTTQEPVTTNAEELEAAQVDIELEKTGVEDKPQVVDATLIEKDEEEIEEEEIEDEEIEDEEEETENEEMEDEEEEIEDEEEETENEEMEDEEEEIEDEEEETENEEMEDEEEEIEDEEEETENEEMEDEEEEIEDEEEETENEEMEDEEEEIEDEEVESEEIDEEIENEEMEDEEEEIEDEEVEDKEEEIEEQDIAEKYTEKTRDEEVVVEKDEAQVRNLVEEEVVKDEDVESQSEPGITDTLVESEELEDVKL